MNAEEARVSRPCSVNDPTQFHHQEQRGFSASAGLALPPETEKLSQEDRKNY